MNFSCASAPTNDENNDRFYSLVFFYLLSSIFELIVEVDKVDKEIWQ